VVALRFFHLKLLFSNPLLTVPSAQHVVAYPAVDSYPEGTQLQCTYISIPQSCTTGTRAVLLSKPSWMWGAEMAANDAGLVIGNEAVWTNEPDDCPEALLGMDLVRLAAERCSKAVQAVNLIGELLQRYGQGGGCEEGGSWSYHNSFLIADRNEAWVMETAGTWWIAESVCTTASDEDGKNEDGKNDEKNSFFNFRNISNCLSIRTLDTSTRKYLHSTGLLEYAVEAGYWDGQGQFDWALSFSSSRPPLVVGEKTPGREAAGHQLLQKLTTQLTSQSISDTNAAKFTAEMMMSVLRDQKSGICMCVGGFRSNGSHVSVIQRSSGSENSSRDVHYFTGTPDPSISCFKPLSFPLEKKEGEKNGSGGGGGADSNGNDVALEEINEIAAKLWDHGDRRNSKSVSRLKELERKGLESAEKDGGEVGGARVYLELARQELEF
jgi:secernin